MIFSKYKLSTKTYTGSLFGENSKSSYINIFKLVNKITLDDNIKYVKLIFSNKLNISLKDKFIYNNINCIKNPWFGMEKIIKLPNYSYINGIFTINIIKGLSANRYIEKKIKAKYSDKLIKGIDNPWYDSNNNNVIVNEEKDTFSYKNGIFRYYKDNISKSKIRPDFKNSFSIEIKVNNKYVNCKIYTNGKIQPTGISDNNSIEKIKEILENKFRKIFIENRKLLKKANIDIKTVPHHIISRIYPENDKMYLKFEDIKDKKQIQSIVNDVYFMRKIKNNLIFSHEINISNIKMELGMVHIRILNNDIFIDQEVIYHHITALNSDKLLASYNNSQNKSLQIDRFIENDYNITYMIFRTGKINITNCKSEQDIINAVIFIKDFLNNDKFILHDTTLHIIDTIIKDNAKGVKQGSKEWLEERKSCVTASVAYKMCMRIPSYGTLDEFIYDKANFVQNGITTFKGNKYTEFGTLMEPIAQKMLINIFNNDPKHKFKVQLYETGLIIDDIHPEIGASPDGILLLMDEHLLKRSLEYLREYYKYFCYNKKLDKTSYSDLYYPMLVEIKCPSNYKPIKESVLYEKPHYYWQMQQQMYVLKVHVCLFMQCKFKWVDETSYTKFEGKFKGQLDNGQLWICEAYDITEVLFDEAVFKNKIPKLIDTFKKIKNYKFTELNSVYGYHNK